MPQLHFSTYTRACRTQIARVLHPYRTRVAPKSHACPMQIAHVSHACRTRTRYTLRLTGTVHMFYSGKPVCFVHYYPYHSLVNQLLVELNRFRCWWKWSSRSTWLSKWNGRRRRVSAPGDFLPCHRNPRSGSSRASSASSSAYVWKNISGM